MAQMSLGESGACSSQCQVWVLVDFAMELTKVITNSRNSDPYELWGTSILTNSPRGRSCPRNLGSNKENTVPGHRAGVTVPVLYCSHSPMVPRARAAMVLPCLLGTGVRCEEGA
jgi:hypothetical protein